MIKKVISFTGKNLANALRDNIILYGALFPIILAFVLNLFIPSVESMKLTVAVEKNVGEEVINKFEKYAKVEIYENRELVKNRVERNDDLAGIVKEGKEYVVLLEGNESGEAEEIASALMEMILSDKPMAQYEHLSLRKDSSRLRDISGALLLLTSILIGGYIVGFSIVDEKETKAIRALAVSPLKVGSFMISHTILNIATSIILAVISTFILVRGSVNYLQVIISIAATTGVGMLLGLLIGILADNLISAIAVVKFQMLVFVGVPIVSLFIPSGLQWLLYIFPNYWAFQSYLRIFNGESQDVGFMTASILAFILSWSIIFVLIPKLKKSLKMR